MKKILKRAGLLLSLTAASLTNASLTLAQSTISFDDFGPSIPVAADPAALVKTIVTLVFVLAAALTFFYLIAGAIAWITSGGDKGKVEEARNKITAAVIGLLILAATWAIFILVTRIAFGDEGELVVPTFNENKKSGGEIQKCGTNGKIGKCDDNRQACRYSGGKYQCVNIE